MPAYHLDVKMRHVSRNKLDDDGPVGEHGHISKRTAGGACIIVRTRPVPHLVVGIRCRIDNHHAAGILPRLTRLARRGASERFNGSMNTVARIEHFGGKRKHRERREFNADVPVFEHRDNPLVSSDRNILGLQPVPGFDLVAVGVNIRGSAQPDFRILAIRRMRAHNEINDFEHTVGIVVRIRHDTYG